MIQVSFTLEPMGPVPPRAQAVVFVTEDSPCPRSSPAVRWRPPTAGWPASTASRQGADGADAEGRGGRSRYARRGRPRPRRGPRQGDFATLGGFAAGKLGKGDATVVCRRRRRAAPARAGGGAGAGHAARLYAFDKYKTVKKDDAEPATDRKITL